MSLFFLSFCDEQRPEGSQFLGACIVSGGDLGDDPTDLIVAIQNAWGLGCNPGGEVEATRFPESVESHVKPSWRNRLLTRAEVEAIDQELKPHGVS